MGGPKPARETYLLPSLGATSDISRARDVREDSIGVRSADRVVQVEGRTIPAIYQRAPTCLSARVAGSRLRRLFWRNRGICRIPLD